MQKKQLLLISGVVLAIIGVVMGKVYLDQERAKIETQARIDAKKTQENLVEVLFAKSAIAEGSTIEVDNVDIKRLSRNQAAQDAVTSLGRVSGMTVTSPIAKGEMITLSKLSRQQSGDLAAATPPGKRAISINVDALASLGGMIKPQDYVDVIAMIPIAVPAAEGKTATQLAVVPLFQNVLVLAVGTQTIAPAAQRPARYGSETPAKSEPASLITLALAPEEASLIAFVQEQGKIRLSLRSPVDAKLESVRPASWDTLFQYLSPPQAPQAEARVEQKPEATVEIYRGLTKEEVPLR